MGTKALIEYVYGSKGAYVKLPRLGVLSYSVCKSGRVVSVPSLHRESTDSLISHRPLCS